MTLTMADSHDDGTGNREPEREQTRRPCHSAEDAVVQWALEHLGPVSPPRSRKTDER